MRLPRDCIVLVAGLDVRDDKGVIHPCLPEEPGEDLDGVTALLMNVHAGVPAAQSGGGDGQSREAARSWLDGQRQIQLGVSPAGAADGDDPEVLAVEVEHDAALQHVCFEGERPSQPGLFVDGEERFNRAELQGLVFEDRQAHRQADAVVRAERRPFGLEDVVLDVDLDRVLGEVEGDVAVLLADHVHVALEDGDGFLLHALGRGFDDDDVADLVGADLQPLFLGEVEDVLPDLLLVLGAAGDLPYPVKMSPNKPWFEIL